MLDMLEGLPGITSGVRDQLDPEYRRAWPRISARAADLRGGEDA